MQIPSLFRKLHFTKTMSRGKGRGKNDSRKGQILRGTESLHI